MVGPAQGVYTQERADVTTPDFARPQSIARSIKTVQNSRTLTLGIQHIRTTTQTFITSIINVTSEYRIYQSTSINNTAEDTFTIK